MSSSASITQKKTMSQNTPEPKKDDSGYVAFGIAIALGFLVMKDTIPLLLLLAGGIAAWRIWKRYHKKQQDQLTHLDQVFYRLIRQNDGWITPLDLAMNAKLPAENVREYLDKRATEFSAQFEVTEQGGILYYFSTAKSWLLSSEDEQIDCLQKHEENSTLPPSQPPEPPQSESAKKNEVALFPVPPSPTKLPLEIPNSLNQLELAKRLNVHPSTLSKWKTKPQFIDWIRQKDPDKMTWKYSEKTKRFYPVFKSNTSSKDNQFLSQNKLENNLKKRKAN
jgi:hypothetical protein